MRSLATYRSKRDFEATPEPSQGARPRGLGLHYSMQCHDATRLHYDLRLEWKGVLLSWAVTRGPSLDPADKRLAVRTEDHPLDYLTFEGTIPEGNYGAGIVMLWDIGAWTPVDDVDRGLEKGHLRLRLHGRRLTGEWHLVRLKGRPEDRGRENWLMIKQEDEAAHRPDPVERYTTSVTSNRTHAQIAGDGEPVPFGPRRTASAPEFEAPMLPTLVREPVGGKGWWHELKFDGYRGLVQIGAEGARIRTRSGLDWSDRFAPLLPAFEELPAKTALIDGEIMAGADLGGFGALQDAISAGGPFRFYAFDLPWLDGRDLRDRSLRDRRRALEKLLADAPPLGLIQLSPVIEGDGGEVLDPICEAGGEGIVSKSISAPWRSGRTTSWVKVKCERRAEFVILGYQKSDKRGRAFSSLLLGTRESKAWVYRGKVGTGFDAETQADLSARMEALETEKMPLAARPPGLKGVVWLQPELVAEIRYGEVTGDGQLRHASFLALRGDKPAREVAMDPPEEDTVVKVSDGERVKVAGVGISSPERRVFPPDGATKLDLARYYEAVAERMLKVAADRPLSLVRLPDGLGGQAFFQKHLRKGWPAGLKPVPIETSDGVEDYMYVTSAAGLVGGVQMGTVEFHIWGSRRDRLDRTDRLVFDLDPDEGLGWPEVRQAAMDLRDLLDGLGLPSWPMVTGGKGIHVVIEIRRTVAWDTAKLFTHTVASHLAETQPERFVANMSKAKRTGRIFVDYLRNERGSTAIAPFSVRARPGGTVAFPLSWQRLAETEAANAWGMERALEEGDWDAVGVPKPVRLEAAIKRMAKEWG
ncbi:DNA ligase D [Paracoccus sp. S-4012]|uniref:DNA ligase D n=1 Tax=Paracoccus sp. S-4012 TaxID=2665648 RepID=UPI0012AFBA48|nr:DNA ligase D [Paracoccus sp. S-4012]MRX51484.1 DNA ligase D [Paracoccus sp. S-4012]